MLQSTCLGIVAFALLVATVQAVGGYGKWADIRPKGGDDYRYSSSMSEGGYFYGSAGNYTVPKHVPGGRFTVREMNLSDGAFVILYLKRNASTRRVHVAEPCLKQEDLSRFKIVKVYTNQTRVTAENEDEFEVGSNNILCYLLLIQRSVYAIDGFGRMRAEYEDEEKSGSFNYTRNDGSNRNDGSMVFVRRKFTVYTKDKCYRHTYGATTLAIKYAEKATNRTSMDHIIISYRKPEEAYVCRGKRCHTEIVTKKRNQVFLGGQTPDGLFKWPLVVSGGELLCVTFVKVGAKVFDHNDVLFQVSEFPTFVGDIYNLTGGMITSPGYEDDVYPKNVNCRWGITVLPGQTIGVEFGETESDCSNDYLMLKNLVGGSQEVLCGSSLTGRKFRSAGNWMNMTFKTSVYGQKKGFLLEYKAIGCSLLNLTFPFASRTLNAESNDVIPPGFDLKVGCITGFGFASGQSNVSLTCLANGTWIGGIPFCIKHASCDDTLTNPTGSIDSPGYPGNSPADTRCNWKIVAKHGQRVKLRFKATKSDCDNDYIILGPMEQRNTNTSVEDGEDTASDRMLLCGDNVSRGAEYTSQNNTMTVVYRTNIYEWTSSFSVVYKAIGCSYTDLRRPSNTEIVNSAVFNPPGYKLRVKCVDGYRFTIQRSEVVMTCGANGRWQGRVPLCISTEGLSNENWS